MQNKIDKDKLSEFRNLFDLSERVALVTGGAQGNGLAIAERLSDAGAISIAADLQYKNYKLTISRKKNHKILKINIDVSNEENVRRCVHEIISNFSKIDILVNNAGIIYKSYIDETDIRQWKKVLDINLTGATICTKIVSSIMKKNHWGRIINISSTQAFLHLPTYGAYSASKAALSHLTKIWATELAPFNIIVNALCPGYVLTPMMERSIQRRQQEKKMNREEAILSFVEYIPQKRILEPKEVGNWVLVLCSALSNSLTGTNISISGGWLMH